MTHAPRLAAVAALSGALAVALGAFAAHGAGPEVRTLLTTGAQYQGLHALLALVCAVAGQRPAMRAAGWLAVAGGLVFSLALAAIGLASLRVMGAVAPVGGLLMIGAWLTVAFAALRPPSPHA
jgi:uncharacterized membrane protein YgdD (TMEM256/DUF423 family)